MAWVTAHYTVVPLAEIAERIARGRSVKGLAALTFDDAYHGSLAHAWPVLRRSELPATLFVPTRLIDAGRPFWWDHPFVATSGSESRREVWLTTLQGDTALIGSVLDGAGPVILPAALRPADWSTIRRAAFEGFELGMHSATHRSLPMLDDIALARELAESRRVLSDRCGVEPTLFSFPYGRHDARVRQAVREAGAAAAVTLDFGLNDGGTDRWALRRVNVPASISRPAFTSWAAGLRVTPAA
jgi:peptidoglycan/xylan/chitin deacetylase (PgdA/CDA1 family)